MISRAGTTGCLSRFIILVLCSPFAFILTNVFFYMHPELNPKWIEPWSVQVVENSNEILLFIHVNEMVRLRGLLISAPIRPTAFFNHLVAVSSQDQVRLVDLDLKNTDIRFSPGSSEIFSLDGNIYLYEYGSSGGSARLYKFRGGQFNLVLSGKAADELLRHTKLGPERDGTNANGQGSRLLELSGRQWIDNEFEWRKSKFTFEKTNDTIKLRRRPPSGEYQRVREIEQLDQSILLPSGAVFQFSVEGRGQRRHP